MLSGYFNVQTVSLGEGFASASLSYASGSGGIYVITDSYTPGVSVLPFNYTNFNTNTTIGGSTPWPWQ